MNTNSRRELLKKTVFGAASSLGVRALATGLPAAFLSRPLQAQAQDFMCADRSRAQYLIICTGDAGDPLNANVPGTYDFPDIAHSPDPNMAGTDFTIRGKTYKAAAAWASMPQWMLDRTVFFHHGTFTNNHANLGKVMKMMGNTARSEMLPSIIAKHLAPCFNTVQVDPISAGAGSILSIDGRHLPNVAPTGLRDLLTKPDTALMRLQDLRDQSLDEIHAVLKSHGTVAQKRYLDSLVLSRTQARSLGTDLLDMLGAIKNDGAEGQVTAAVALIKMNVSSVITIRVGFGGDNHTDVDLLKEAAAQTSGVQRFVQLHDQLKMAGLEDKVTFAAYYVFGRTLKKLQLRGRDHWGSHHTTVMMGKHVKGGMVGYLEPKANDYYATPIDSATGEGRSGGGDIPFNETLSAMGKTLGAAVGMPPEAMDRWILGGKVVKAAVG